MRITNIIGIDVELHWTFLLLLILAFLTGGVGSVILLIILFGSVLLHELAHSYVAQKNGIVVKRITLFPIGGVASVDEFAMAPTVELKVALAGPFLNFILAFIAFILWSIFGNQGVLSILHTVMAANIMLGTFNLLPAIPLDGGRIWRALRERKTHDFLSATKEAVRLSRWVIIIIVLLSFFLSLFLYVYEIMFWNLIIAFFIYVGSDAELETAFFRAAAEGLRVRRVMRREVFLLSGEETLEEAYEIALSENIGSMLIIEDGRFKVVSVGRFSDIPRKRWRSVLTKRIAVCVQPCSPRDPLLNVWKRMQGMGVGFFPVVEGGVLLGHVTGRDVERAIMIRRIGLG